MATVWLLMWAPFVADCRFLRSVADAHGEGSVF